jgi:predicted nucleic acid-binding protein
LQKETKNKGVTMPAITLKNIPNDLYDQIKKSASMNYRSINGEILYRLHHSLGYEPIDPELLLQKIDRLQKKIILPKLTDKTLELAKTESEFRNVLTLYIRQAHLSLEDAQNIMNEAEEFLTGNEYEVNSFEVFDLVSSSNCSAYDCAFVALAKRLGLDFYTSDKKVLKEFPDIASDLKKFQQ